MMMMSFICSYRNKIGAELHIYLENGAYHKRLFRGNCLPTPHTTPFFLPPEGPYPVLLRPNSTQQKRSASAKTACASAKTPFVPALIHVVHES